MILDWFNSVEAVTFARGIVSDINSLFPPTPQGKRAMSANKDRKKLDKLLARTRTFAQQHKLNVYKKAKFLNTVKWELKDAGHDEAFVNEMVTLLAPLLN